MGQAAQPQIHQHRHGQPQVIPIGLVVAGPAHRVPLYTGPPGTGDADRALGGPQSLQSLDRRPGHAHTVDVVGCDVVAPASFQVVAGEVGEGRAQLSEHGRLVHVVPHAVHTHVGQRLVQISPPRSHAGSGEVGEVTVAGPDGAFERRLAVGEFAEHVLLQAALADPIVGVGLDARINDDDNLESLLVEVGDQAGRVGEALCVPGEAAVAVHVVDV